MYCDRCKKEFEKWNHKRKELIGIGEIIREDEDQYLDSQKDLCESCYVELENWWNFNSKTEVKINNRIYMRGYEDGKSDVLNKIREEVGEEICLTDNPYTKETNYTIEHLRLLEILDNISKSESEDKKNE